jgi:hypothetical protein
VEELLDGTLAEAAEKLAALAAYHRTGPAEKTAAPEWLTALGEQVKNNPALSHALIGGGLGAAGLGANTALNNRGQEAGKKKSVLGSMLTGGLAGAGAGAGVGLARQGLSELKNPGGGISGTDALRPGQFVDPATGRRMMIDPQALKDNPQLHEQVRALTTPTLQSRIAGGAAGAYDAIRQHVPTTAPLVAGAGAVDFALHNPLFGLSKIRPHQASGQIGKELFQLGAEGDKNLSEAMRKGFGVQPSTAAPPTTGTDTHVQLHDRASPSGAVRRWYESIKGRLGMRPNNPTLGDILGGRPGAVDGSRPVATVSYVPEHKGKTVEEFPSPGPGQPSRKVETETVNHGDRTPKTIRETDVAQAKHRGYNSSGYAGRQLFRTLGRTYAGAGSVAGAVAPRAALYGLPLAGEYIARGIQEDGRNRQTLNDIYARYARPVPERQGGR